MQSRVQVQLILIAGGLAFLMLTTVAIALAWEPSDSGAPYTGVYSKTFITGGIRTNANSIKWNSSGQSTMILRQQSGLSNILDQTADCTANSSQGDKLRYQSVNTNLPNRGISTYDDCDGPGPNVNEEVEINIQAFSIVPESSYYYRINWQYNVSSPHGEVNVTYQVKWCCISDWLDKVTY